MDKISSCLGDLGLRGFLGFCALGAIRGMGMPEKPIVRGPEVRPGEQSSSSELGKLYGSWPWE